MLVRSHVVALCAARVDVTPTRPVEASLLKGDWSLLHQGRWGIDYYDPWGDRWRASDLSRASVVELLRQRVQSSEHARALLRPPIWSIHGQPDVYEGHPVADDEAVEKLHRMGLQGRDRLVALSLLLRAGNVVLNAVFWELALGAGAVEGTNPFDSLVTIYELGYFPMGLVGNCYELYVPTFDRR